MKKPLLKRIKWTRIAVLLSAALAAGAVGYSYYRDTTETSLVEYHRTIEAGDTLWGVVGQIATDKVDMCKLTWQVMKDNKIEDPGNLQPGTVIVIRVKEARAL